MLSLRQAIAGEASAGMDLVDEYALFHARIFVHDLFHFIDVGVEDPNPGYIASIGDRAHDRQQAIGPEGEIPAPVLPDDLFDAGFVSVRAGPEDDEGVGFGAGERLAHGGVGDFRHVKLLGLHADISWPVFFCGDHNVNALGSLS